MHACMPVQPCPGLLWSPIHQADQSPSPPRCALNEEKKKKKKIECANPQIQKVIYTLFYVVPFYLSATTRPSRTLSRDAPSVIRARVASVSLTCVVCSLITFAILTSEGGVAGHEALHSMGYWPLGLPEAARSLLLTAVLFGGPLYEALLVDGQWRRWLSPEPVTGLFTDWVRWRNIIAGPFTEEVLFRSASVPLMLLARTSVARTVFLSPVIFGLAHVHHFYEFRLTHPHEPVATGLLRSLLQLAYTSLFGAYATFLFLRTGSLLAIFAVHAFCNVMGLPRLWGRVEPPSSSSDDADGDSDAGDRDAGKPPPRNARPSLLWSVVYYVLLVGGAVGWWKNLGVLTASDNALVTMKI
ncbi:CaaX protease [Nemania serpens]|nr:CaaX protease [Nemania serpens]